MMNVYSDDIANGLEPVPISFSNKINNINVPSSVSYVPNCVLESDSLAEDFESVSLPCSCVDSCNSDCSCARYTTAYSDGKFSPCYDRCTDKPIIECSVLCNCNNDCKNRVVQNGIQFSLQVFMTETKGFGVRTMEFIPRYAFVCEYAGEIIDSEEAQKRFQRMGFHDSNYIYVLNEHISDDSCIKTIIDPTYNGNVGRFLNHSCSPNLISVPVRANSMIPRICFFANDDILPLQELTYDYGGTDITNMSPLCNKDSEIISARKCRCQASNCIGLLPFSHNLLR